MAMTLEEHLHGPGPKRILSLDGGGVRGLITLGMLKRVEDILKVRSSDPDSFRLCDYFDLIGGTSTGALIATLLALGETVDEIADLYFRMCPKVFSHRLNIPFLQSVFDTKKFRQLVAEEIKKKSKVTGVDEPPITLGSDMFKTGVAIVAKRLDSASVWVQTNNPRRKFWDPESPIWRERLQAQGLKFLPNRDYELLDVILASASAPYYFGPVKIKIENDSEGVFIDGGASPYNNPALELFMMATLKGRGPAAAQAGPSPFGFEWETGSDNVFLLSVGTGSYRNRIHYSKFSNMAAAVLAKNALMGIIDDTATQATTMLQALGEVPKPQTINAKLQDMTGLSLVSEPLLHFRRLDVTLDAEWLGAHLGEEYARDGSALHHLRRLENGSRRNHRLCHSIGLQAGKKLVEETDLPEKFDIKAVDRERKADGV